MIVTRELQKFGHMHALYLSWVLRFYSLRCIFCFYCFIFIELQYDYIYNVIILYIVYKCIVLLCVFILYIIFCRTEGLAMEGFEAFLLYSFIHSFIHCVCMCTCGCFCVSICVCMEYHAMRLMWKTKINFWESVLSFHNVNSWDSSQGIRFRRKPLLTISSCVFLSLVSFTPSVRILIVHHEGLSKISFFIVLET